MAERFIRGKYRDEEQTIGPSLDAIENAYGVLLALPDKDSVAFFSLQDHEKAAQSKDLQASSAYLLSDAFNWFKFFWYSTAFKARHLAGALVHAYNTDNYLAWMILGRSSLEFAAIAYHYIKKINQLELRGPNFAASHIKTFEDLLLEYVHGTRFSWTDLLAGNLKELKKEPSPASSLKAVNVLTALGHLAKRDARYKDIEIAYAMLSDFAHPNMASHTTVVEMATTATAMHQCKLAVDPGALRGEFIMVLSAPWVSTGIGTSLELLIEVTPILRAWSDYMDASAQVRLDFSK